MCCCFVSHFAIANVFISSFCSCIPNGRIHERKKVALRPLCPELIEIWKCWFLRRGENRSTRRKTSRSKDENQQQTQTTSDAESGNRTPGHTGGRRVLSSLRHAEMLKSAKKLFQVFSTFSIQNNSQKALPR